MVLTLLLTAAEEAKLLAKAQAEGLTPEALVKNAIGPIIDGVSGHPQQTRKPKKSMLGLLAKYGPAPSAEEIDENRKEMFSDFGRDDIA
jgi:hypothetical protein